MPTETNSVEYWDQRFATGDWEEKRGREQTILFATKQVSLLSLPDTFNGSLLDFGCGLGDALTVYRRRFPSAQLAGIDHSQAAIRKCREKYGELGEFIAGGPDSAPKADIIVASNVFEHLTDDKAVAAELLSKCSDLYIFVPYRERLVTGSEHVNSYDEHSFAEFEVIETKLFYCRGWTPFGRVRWVNVYLKNLVRPLLGKPLVYRQKQIMFRIRGATLNCG